MGNFLTKNAFNYNLTRHIIGREILQSESVPKDDIFRESAQVVEDSSIVKTSIDENFVNKKYGKNIYLLFKDIKTSTISNLIKYPVGSSKYVQLDNFFRFIIDLTIREAARLGFLDRELKTDYGEVYNEANNAETAVVKSTRHQYVNNYTPDLDFEAEVMNGFAKVYSDIKEWYGEAFYVLGQNGPLYSSLSNKSSIDPRDTELRGKFQSTRLIPYRNMNQMTYQLAYVSPTLSRIPHPALPPTEILHKFVHTIDNPLPSTKYMKFGSYTTFSPVVDDSKSLLASEEVAATWFDKTAFQRLKTEQEVQNYALRRIAELEKYLEEYGEDGDEDLDEEVSDEGEDPTVKQAETKTNGTSEPAQKQIVTIDDVDMKDVGTNDEIDIASIFEWGPHSFTDDDEIEAAREGTESQLISKLLLDLQNLQRIRLSHNDGSEFVIGDDERHLALKIQNLLSRTVANYSPKAIDLAPSTKLPVLQNSYPGTLPAADPKTQTPRVTNARSTPARRGGRR